ncbi:hypothetical protein GF380_05605, partial [Candidatus Uhrbacteria bacterium]|nr:hypothetical protein [Candidatus Uhrbacteria bacterium]
MTKHNDDLKAAIDAMDLDKARRIFRDAQAEADAETYYLASKIALDDEQKQEFLQKALELDPFHEKARAALKGDSQAQSSAPPVAPAALQAANPEDFVSATVKAPEGQTNLMLIPFEQGEVRTVIKDGATVYIVSRYTDPEKQTWYNVVYQSTVSTAHGWLPAETLGDLHVRGQEIEPMDIPVTEFQFNEKDDFKSIYDKVNAKYTNAVFPISMLGVLLFLVFFVALIIPSIVLAVIAGVLCLLTIFGGGYLLDKSGLIHK